MPMYAYTCNACGHQVDDFRTIDHRNFEHPCTACPEGVLKRDQARELQGTPQTDWTEPIYSEAAGVHPDQIAEARARFPHHEFTPDGRMIFRSRAHQKQCLRDIGMFDKDSYG